MRRIHSLEGILILMTTLFCLVACQKQVNNKTIISGQVINPVDTVQRFTLFPNGAAGKLKLKIDKEGKFRDTLDIDQGTLYRVIYGSGNYVMDLYLKNGMNLKLKFDPAHKVSEDRLSFSGEGRRENTLILQKNMLYYDIIKDNGGKEKLFELSEADFKGKVEKEISEFSNSLEDQKHKLDTVVYKGIENALPQIAARLTANYQRYQQLKKLAKGSVSPKFEDYPNAKGGTNSLADYKGKYVYIDLWATWCKPCLKEMPYLKKIEEQYKEKNIAFLSISLDNPKSKEKWKKMIEERQLGGVQLFGGDKSTFAEAYQVTGIPRYILLDPEGKIVDADAPRPSNPKLKAVFKGLDIE